MQFALYRSGYNALQAHALLTLKGLNQSFSALSNREQEVLLLDLNGSDVRQIVVKLGISEETARPYRKLAFIKPGMNTKSRLFQIILRRIINRRNIE